MEHASAVDAIQSDVQPLLSELANVQGEIRRRLQGHSGGKKLKGNEIVGWLGEIYGRAFFEGKLVPDTEEHDVETPDGRRISVKTRKGWGGGWTRSSAIPAIDGENRPTHLLFVHLDEDYSLLDMWLFDWCELARAGRFKSHVVRDKHRSFVFTLDPNKDKDWIVYTNDETTSHLLRNPKNAKRLRRSIFELQR